MRNIDAAALVGLGDEVVTAGIELGGGIRSPYPKGLVIGRVVDVRRDANEVVQTAFLEPAATLDRLEFVLVILDYAVACQDPTSSRPRVSRMPMGPFRTASSPVSTRPRRRLADAAPPPANDPLGPSHKSVAPTHHPLDRPLRDRRCLFPSGLHLTAHR